MKKVVALTLIFYYIYSFAFPYFPTFCNFISKTIWENSHNEKVKYLSPRSNILVVLKDMAEENSPEKSKVPNSDSLIPSTFSYLEVFPKFKFSILFVEVDRKLFSHLPEDFSLFFKDNPVPPPRFA